MSNLLNQAYELVNHPDQIFALVSQVLAVVGGAAIGGFGFPWLVQMAVRGWTGQQMPRWIMMTLRVGIGGLSGWLVMVLLIHHGLGGNGNGNGNGKGNSNNNSDTNP